MEQLKFTIISPSFQQGAFLEETIRSVLDQDYSNVEYFVIDGGSTDNSVELLEKYAHRLAYCVSEKDRGQSHAINKGLQRATGDIVIWINSDDLLCPGALKQVAEIFLQNPDVDVVHGKTLLFGAGREIVKGAVDLSLPEQYLAGMAFPQPSAFVRHAAIRKWHPVLDESLNYGMDFDLFACLYLNGNFLSVPQVFSKYRLHASSKTMTSNALFALDWQTVFSRVIDSLDLADARNRLIELGMYRKTNTLYPVSRKLQPQQLEKALMHFFHFQIVFFYQGLRLAEVRKIADYLKRHFPDFYSQNGIQRLRMAAMAPFARYIIPLLRKSAL